MISYVKNSFLGFAIPYSKGGKDSLWCVTPDGVPVNLVIEVTGMNKEKQDKKWYVENHWLPAVNEVREKYEMDEWHFIEIANDIRNIKQQLTNKIISLDAVAAAV